MLKSKDDAFSELFKKVMNLHLGVSVGKPIADKDRTARVLQAIKESLQ
jgi:hypothetical protein